MFRLKSLRHSVVLAALCLAACSNPEPPAGGWRLDVERTLAANEASMLAELTDSSPEAQAPAREVIQKTYSNFECTMKLNPDGTFRVRMLLKPEGGGLGAAPPVKGTWQAEGETITLTNRDERGREFVHRGTWTPTALELDWMAVDNTRQFLFARDE